VIFLLHHRSWGLPASRLKPGDGSQTLQAGGGAPPPRTEGRTPPSSLCEAAASGSRQPASLRTLEFRRCAVPVQGLDRQGEVFRRARQGLGAGRAGSYPQRAPETPTRTPRPKLRAVNRGCRSVFCIPVVPGSMHQQGFSYMYNLVDGGIVAVWDPGPGGPRNLSNRSSAWHPDVSKGFWGRRGRPELKHRRL